MVWTKQRKVFVGVLAVAGAALIADRSFFGAAPLGAGTVLAGQDSPAAKAATPVVTPATSSPAGPTLVARLEALRDKAVDEDPFVSPFVDSTLPAAPVAEAPAAPEFDAAACAARHKLSAVMNGKNGSVAMIGGKVYRVGDTLDGLTLTRIENQNALFEGNGASAELLVRQFEPR